ncbi:DUF4286 family protein [Salibacteraceae bacterium]|nr:DUF4286 family protein [Salibacteraceae bacterium]
MIIYNVTVKIEPEVHSDWLEWMKQKHIPDVMKTGCFIQNEIAKVLIDEKDGITYSIQYRCESISELNNYFEIHAPALQKEHLEKYKEKFVAFRTLLELV